MTITHNTQHVSDALRRRLAQFKQPRPGIPSSSPVLGHLIATFVAQVQELENAHIQLLNKRSVDSAVGAQLDGIGQIVGLKRGTNNDADYRMRLRAWILLSISHGTPENLIALVRTLIGDRTIRYTESYPAHFDITILEPIEVSGYQISALIHSGKPAGVRGIVSWHETDTPFVFAGDPDGRGFEQGNFAGAVDL